MPVDFLLGRVREPVAGRVHEWVIEHQARLQVAFEGARERLQTVAAKHKERHDQHVKNAPLVEGQLVYLHDYGVRGRHKIHDVWSSVVYQVVRAPREGGAVYTIASVENQNTVKTVHRSQLKSRVRREPSGPVPPSNSSDPLVPRSLQEEEEEEVDLVRVCPESSSGSPHWVRLASPEQVVPPLASGSLDPVPMGRVIIPEESSVVEMGSVAEPVGSGDGPGRGEVGLRRTGRVTAGQHSNPHHLPRPLLDVAPSVSHSVTVVFRPWI